MQWLLLPSQPTPPTSPQKPSFFRVGAVRYGVVVWLVFFMIYWKLSQVTSSNWLIPLGPHLIFFALLDSDSFPATWSEKERPRYATLDNELDATKKEIGVAAQAEKNVHSNSLIVVRKYNNIQCYCMSQCWMSLSKKCSVSRFCLGLPLSALNIARSTRPLGRFLQNQLLKQACRVRAAYLDFCLFWFQRIIEPTRTKSCLTNYIKHQQELASIGYAHLLPAKKTRLFGHVRLLWRVRRPADGPERYPRPEAKFQP